MNTPERDCDNESKIIIRSNEPIQSVINGIGSQKSTIDNISERPSFATVPRGQTLTTSEPTIDSVVERKLASRVVSPTLRIGKAIEYALDHPDDDDRPPTFQPSDHGVRGAQESDT